MARYTLSMIFLIILLGFQKQISAEDEYNLRQAIEDVGLFIPGAGEVIEKGLKVYDIFDKILKKIDNAPTEPSVSDLVKNVQKTTDQVLKQTFKNEEKLNDLKNIITTQVALDDQMLEIFDLINEIHSNFDEFVYDVLWTNLGSGTLHDKANGYVSGNSKKTIYEKLTDINRKLHNSRSGLALLNLITDGKQMSEMMCRNKKSPMHVLNILYNDIVKAEIKGLIMTKWSYQTLRNETHSFIPELERYLYGSELRLIDVSKKIKTAMQQVRRDFWKCDPPHKSQGNNYVRLSPIFRTHIMPEYDAAEMRNNKLFEYELSGSCEEFKKKKLLDACNSDLCKSVQGRCKGYVRECYLHERGSKMEVCLANQKYEDRKYMYVKINDELYGSSDECDHKNITIEGSTFVDEFNKRALQELTQDEKISFSPAFARFARITVLLPITVANSVPIYKKENCICTCDETDRDYANRYFSLRDVVSDIHQNKIITGARIVQKDLMIQIEIQEGTLLKNGNVNQTSVYWTKASPYNVIRNKNRLGKDFHKLSWDIRTVNIDAIEAPPSTVLTGLRFEVEDNHVKLGIRYTPINFATGVLDQSSSKWKSMSNNDQYRKEIKFDPALPTDSDHQVVPSDKKYIQFTTSSFKKDVGQTVVPFLDIQELSTDTASLLSGAGLIYRGSPVSAGFLALKLFTYDFEPHLIIPAAPTQKLSLKGRNAITL